MSSWPEILYLSQGSSYWYCAMKDKTTQGIVLFREEDHGNTES